MSSARRKRLIRTCVIFLALVALIVGLVVKCNGSSSSTRSKTSSTTAMSNRDIGSDITASGNKVPSDIKATSIKNITSPFKGGVIMTTPVDITPSGPLAAPVTLRFKLNRPVLDGRLVIATREPASSAWTYETPSVSADGLYASIVTTHFSLHLAIHLDIKIPVPGLENIFGNPADALDIEKSLKDDLTGGFTAKAQRPECQKESQARGDNYVITSSAKDTLYWCFGVENGVRILKVVNRKRYPLDITHAGLTVKSAGTITAGLDQLARLASGKHTILFPHDTAVFVVNLAAGHQASLSTSYSLSSGEAVTLNGLETALEAVNDNAVNAGVGKTLAESELYKATNDVLKGKDCYSDVVINARDKILLDCLGGSNPEQLSKISTKFGPPAVLGVFVKSIGSLANWFASAITGNVDSIKGDASYTVLVSRKLVKTKPAFLPTKVQDISGSVWEFGEGAFYLSASWGQMHFTRPSTDAVCPEYPDSCYQFDFAYAQKGSRVIFTVTDSSHLPGLQKGNVLTVTLVSHNEITISGSALTRIGYKSPLYLCREPRTGFGTPLKGICASTQHN